MCKQDAEEINNFKFHSEPDKNFKIVRFDENSGDFGFYSVDQPYFTLKFYIDKNSSEKYLDLVTLEIVDHVYYHDDASDKMKIAELIKKAFAKAATQKKSSPEKIDEVEKSGIIGQTELILKDNGLEFLYFAYNPCGKYFIASEDYAKTSEDFAQGEKAVKVAEEVQNEQKIAEQKQKEQEEYYKKHPEELQKKLQAEKEEQERRAIAEIMDKYFFETPPKKVFPSDGKNHFAVYNRYNCIYCGAHFYIGGYKNVEEYYDTSGAMFIKNVTDNILMVVGIPTTCSKAKEHHFAGEEIAFYQDFGKGKWVKY